MMGKRTFWTGIALGAIVGGLTALLDQDARRYVKDTCSEAKRSTSFYLNNPSEAVQTVRKTVKTLNENLGKGAASAMNALEQLEQTLEKRDNQPNQIKLLK